MNHPQESQTGHLGYHVRRTGPVSGHGEALHRLPAQRGQWSAPEVHTAFAWNPKDQSEFQRRYQKFIRAYADKFGRNLDGWWFDGCYEWDRFHNSLYDWPNWFAFSAHHTLARLPVGASAGSALRTTGPKCARPATWSWSKRGRTRSRSDAPVPRPPRIPVPASRTSRPRSLLSFYRVAGPPNTRSESGIYLDCLTGLTFIASPLLNPWLGRLDSLA